MGTARPGSAARAFGIRTRDGFARRAQRRVSGALPIGRGDDPCPCGWAGDSSGRCHCATDAIRRYRARISGPLLDRIDLHIDVPRLPPQALRPDQPGGESSADIRARVTLARERQFARSGKTNAQLDQAGTAAICRLSERDQGLLERAVDALQLSARSMHRIQRVARTIADLAGSEAITTAHLTEAIGYRRNDAATSGAR